MPKADNLLAVLWMLRSAGKPITARQLADALEISVRTVCPAAMRGSGSTKRRSSPTRPISCCRTANRSASWNRPSCGNGWRESRRNLRNITGADRSGRPETRPCRIDSGTPENRCRTARPEDGSPRRARASRERFPGLQTRASRQRFRRRLARAFRNTFHRRQTRASRNSFHRRRTRAFADFP